MNKIELPCFGIIVIVNNGRGTITSTGLITKYNDDEDKEYDAAMNGIESMILAHACAGVNINTPEYIEGIETAVNSCVHNY